MSIRISLVVPACSACGRPEETVGYVLDGCTHNLQPMWKAAGCLDALYERDGAMAYTIERELSEALARMKTDPDRFRAFNPPNGWGDYDGAVRALERGLANVRAFPTARLDVSR